MTSVLRNPLVPIEVIPFASEIVKRNIEIIGGKATVRKRDEKIFVSDNGNYILDCQFENIVNVAKLNSRLKDIVGVVETGLFVNIVDTVITGHPEGIQVRNR